jgi:Ca2+-transporting ATPase
MVIVQKIHAFSFLSSTRSLFSLETFRNKWLNIAFVATVGLQVALVYWEPAEELFGTVPLTAAEWGAILGAVVVPVILIDQAKLAFSRYRSRKAAEGVLS